LLRLGRGRGRIGDLLAVLLVLVIVAALVVAALVVAALVVAALVVLTPTVVTVVYTETYRLSLLTSSPSRG
jgi:hypothetical protein